MPFHAELDQLCHNRDPKITFQDFFLGEEPAHLPIAADGTILHLLAPPSNLATPAWLSISRLGVFCVFLQNDAVRQSPYPAKPRIKSVPKGSQSPKSPHLDVIRLASTGSMLPMSDIVVEFIVDPAVLVIVTSQLSCSPRPGWFPCLSLKINSVQ